MASTVPPVAVTTTPTWQERYIEFVKMTYPDDIKYAERLLKHTGGQQPKFHWLSKYSGPDIHVAQFFKDADPKYDRIERSSKAPARLESILNAVATSAERKEGVLILIHLEIMPDPRHLYLFVLAIVLKADPRMISLIFDWARYAAGNTSKSGTEEVFRDHAFRRVYGSTALSFDNGTCPSHHLGFIGEVIFEATHHCRFAADNVFILLSAARIHPPESVEGWLRRRASQADKFARLRLGTVGPRHTTVGDFVLAVLDEDICLPREHLRTILQGLDQISLDNFERFQQLFIEFRQQKYVLKSVSDSIDAFLDHTKDAYYADADIPVRELHHQLLLKYERSEPEIRDTYQQSVNQATFLETRKSIEMAEKSIKESERVRVLTILAFIFLPISLATSVFGMNVQEINDSGKPIWAFVITAIVLLASALIVWAMSSFAMRVQKLKSIKELQSWVSLRTVDAEELSHEYRRRAYHIALISLVKLQETSVVMKDVKECFKDDCNRIESWGYTDMNAPDAEPRRRSMFTRLFSPIPLFERAPPHLDTHLIQLTEN